MAELPDRGGQQVFVVGLWRRVAACLVDGVCLSPALLLAGWLALKVTGLPQITTLSLRPEVLLELVLWGGLPFYSAIGIAFGLTLLYSYLFVALTGNTPGMRLFSVRVINVYGDRPEWWRALLRCGGTVLGLGLLGLGLLWIGFDREKRGLHDWLAGTYVVHSKSYALNDHQVSPAPAGG